MSKSKGRGNESSSKLKLLSRRTDPDCRNLFLVDPLRSNIESFELGEGVKLTNKFSIKKKNLVLETVLDQIVILYAPSIFARQVG